MRTAVCLVLMFLPAAGRAGIYSPDEPFLFELDPGPVAKPVQYSGGFDTILADYRDVNAPGSRLHAQITQRVQKRRAAGVNRLSPDDLAGYTADLLRVNRGDEVLNFLHPIARDPRRGGFLVYTHMAKAHSARGEWREAAEQELMATKFTEFPATFAKLTRDQLAWLKKVEKDFYYPWLKRRAEEAAAGRAVGLNEQPDRLFPAGGKADADFVKYVGADGIYQPGKIAEAEKAKLPPDAVAIVQQMLMWHPNDARLFWQLGELYNAEGEAETAAKILDLCSYTQGYSNPHLLEHRRLLQSAVSETATAKVEDRDRRQREFEAESAAKAQEKNDEQKRKWWIISVAVAGGLFLLYYQVREVRKRLRRKR